MRVLWFANTPCGATEKLTDQKVTSGGWLYALSQALGTNRGMDLHIAFYWGEKMSAFEYRGITYHPIFRNGLGSKLGRYLYRLKQQYSSTSDKVEIEQAVAIVRTVEPDIIHFHGSEENFGLAAKYIKHIPMVLSIQGMLSTLYYKQYSGYPQASILRHESLLPKILIDGIRANDRRMRMNAEREARIYQHIPNVIGRTAWDKDCSLAMNANRRYFVCNEILRPEFMSAVWRQPSNDGNIVLATTISHGLYKGLEMVYETSQILTRQHISFTWNIIGVAPGDSFDQTTRKVTGIVPTQVNIHLLGRKDASQMIHILNDCNIFIQVSHIENSPNSLCEAMVLGMPIIASFAGGTSSMLKDEEEGILVQDGDPFRLAGAIISMSRNYVHAISMGRSARERALKRHSPENVTYELLSIYHTLCNAPN